MLESQMSLKKSKKSNKMYIKENGIKQKVQVKLNQ